MAAYPCGTKGLRMSEGMVLHESDEGGRRRTWFGHPRGLSVLFFAEMWERFSFYGMRALLVLYLTQHFLFSDVKAQGIYAAYASLVYLMPVVGGFIADRYLGPRKAMIGNRGVMSGNGGEGADSGGDQEIVLPRGEYESIIKRDLFSEGVMFLALSLIIVGVGFLKANISTIVGELYHKNDDRRDSGFTIFYMEINLGSLMATIFCGWLGIAYGWKYGFGLAGLGMLRKGMAGVH